jgi:hypothetical protein
LPISRHHELNKNAAHAFSARLLGCGGSTILTNAASPQAAWVCTSAVQSQPWVGRMLH